MSKDATNLRAAELIAGTDISGALRIPRVNPDGTVAVGGLGSGTGVPTSPGAKPSTATASPTRFANLGANATLNVKASSGNVFSLYCYNDNAALRFIQLHNTVTVPADQEVPLYSFPVNPSNFSLIDEAFFSAAGANFTLGIAFAFSTTRNTYTAGTAGEQATVIHFK